MFSFRGHGGECCGIYHIYGFGDDLHEATKNANWSFEQEEKDFKYLLESKQVNIVHFDQRLLEVVLSKHQMKPKRLKMLKEAGFKFVCSFVNSNTFTDCYVFHRYIPKNFQHYGKHEYSTELPIGWKKVITSEPAKIPVE